MPRRQTISQKTLQEEEGSSPKKQKPLKVLIANITSWSHQVEEYLKSKKSVEYALIGVSEHHLLHKQIIKKSAGLQEAAKWVSNWTPAKKSPNSATGTAGGTAWIRNPKVVTTQLLETQGRETAPSEAPQQLNCVMSLR